MRLKVRYVNFTHVSTTELNLKKHNILCFCILKKCNLEVLFFGGLLIYIYIYIK